VSGAWRRFTAGFALLLEWLLIGTVMVLIVPVTMQIVSRYTALIPRRTSGPRNWRASCSSG
jgi:hypothetical protein